MSSKSDLILGALVGDASALGTHWIYDKGRVAEVGSVTVTQRNAIEYYSARSGQRFGRISN